VSARQRAERELERATDTPIVIFRRTGSRPKTALNSTPARRAARSDEPPFDAEGSAALRSPRDHQPQNHA
jgi:hypothetical protein